ncbi:helix-turn-helix domain-containing protein [Arthrobacter sp. zg-Y40]|uniref:helix-turn-helix domain-containing protein n=1 Tax=Arthrobacter sp. zg-Y40 TaxID=2886939 RepID=UPI001D1347FD|nr:helix-turn-helix domain-containing protein [Arthrobacter sp. zg-Y40]
MPNRREGRTAFSARFAALVGEPPMSYLTRWRMGLAQSRLLEGSTSISALAGELGYRSGASSARAFLRVVGQTPGSVRTRRDAAASRFCCRLPLLLPLQTGSRSPNRQGKSAARTTTGGLQRRCRMSGLRPPVRRRKPARQCRHRLYR